MSEAKHTPLPWIVGSFSAVTGDAVQYIQTLGHGKQPTHVSECHSGRAGDASREEREANAAFIVRACNSYSDLLAALIAATERMEAVAAGILVENRAKGVSQATHVRHMAGHLAQHAEIARAAIAKATT